MIEQEVSFIPLDKIQIDPERAARRKISEDKVQELSSSILEHGLVHPILIEQDSFLLIAGGHRLAAYALLAQTHQGYSAIPAHFAKDVSKMEILSIELEENIKRNEMHWKEITLSVRQIHDLWLNSDPGWTLAQTAEKLSLSSATVSMYLRVAKEILQGNDKILACTGIFAARNILERQDERAIANEMDLIGETEMEASEIQTTAQPVLSEDGSISFPEGAQAAFPPPAPAAEILCEDFEAWAQSYSGPRFNFIHCDFPYGINHQNSMQGRSAEWGQYEDSEDTYWALCHALTSNLPTLAAGSCHILFWFSMNFYEKTVAYFESAGLTVQPFPLIWHKSDGKGILPDPQRGPRRIYETALLMSLGDRKVVAPVANLYAAPAKKELHLSEKPESMLRHFFRMLVDEHTIMLDPTCGSGTSVRAAFGLKAKRALGLEILPENAEAAQQKLSQTINLAKASEARHGQEL